MAPPANEEERLKLVEAHMNKCWFFQKGTPGTCLHIKMNPLVSLAAALLLWGFIIIVAVMPDHVNYGMLEAKEWVALQWSWIYIISQDIWIVALIYAAVHPKYGKLKMGRDDEEPVYSDVTWFSLLFTCGVAVGLFYFAAEPMWHFKGWGGGRFIKAANGYSHPSEDAVHGMMVTWYHWGLHGWIPYTTIGALLGLLAYRRGFPLSIRFGLYPLIGDRVYGVIGDLTDILSIVTTIMGVCTSLGLGCMSLNHGLSRLSLGFWRGTAYNVPDEPKFENPTCDGIGHKYWIGVKMCDEKWVSSVDTTTVPDTTNYNLMYTRESSGIQFNLEVQVAIIVVVTLLATVSVVTGLDRGIKELSRLGFALSVFLMLFVLFAGDTVFQLNLTVQALGYYIWYLPKIAFHTDAFNLLNTAEYGRGGFPVQGNVAWMDVWTIFYWGWWISWGPFVGTFLAKISRGRTVRQFVVATLIVPSLFSFTWFGTVGGEIILQQTLAEGSGVCNSWLNNDNCQLAPEEMGVDGTCDRAKLLSDGLIAPGDEQNCGRLACSGETLKKGKCGKLLPICEHYAASFSSAQKKALGKGYTPPCKLSNNGEQAPALSGRCQEFAWEHYEQKMDQCVKLTTWVAVPCSDDDEAAQQGGSFTDPTAGVLPCSHCIDAATNVMHPGCKTACQDQCKDTITAEMVDPANANRMYNHFTPAAVKSDATMYIWDHMNDDFSPDKDLDMTEVFTATNVMRRQPQCFVPAPNNQVCVWNQMVNDVLFDLIGALTNSHTFNDFISVITLLSLVIYFITSSDSGSLVVDIMAANGEEEPPILQRIFWAFTEGAVAIALLYSGKNVLGPFGDPGEGGLRACQAASIVMGLPYTFMLFWYSQALVQVCREEAGDLDPERPRMAMFLISAPKSARVPLGRGLLMLLRNLFVPGLSPAVKIGTMSWPAGELTKGVMWMILLQLLWLLSVVCDFMAIIEYQIHAMALAIFVGFAAFVSLVRREVRKQWGIPRGDFITDFICSLLAYPFVLTQLEIQMEEDKIAIKDARENGDPNEI